MQRAVSFERNRVVGVLAASVVFGGLTGYWGWGLALGGFGLAAHNIWRGHQVARWLAGQGQEPPVYEGLWAFIASEIHRERRQNRTQRREISRLLRRYRDSAEALPDAAVLIDTQRQIQWANRKARELLGIDNVLDRGQRVDNLLRDPAVKPLFSRENPAPEAHSRSPQDNRVQLTLRLSRYGEGALLVAQDVSAAMAAQEMRQTFVANASHELRTPLTVVAGHLELLADDPALPDHVEQSLQSAHREANRMLAIVEDLLTLTSLENTQLNDAQSEPIAVAAEVSDLVEATRLARHYRGQTLTLDLDTGLCLRGRKTEVMSVVRNLVNNALRHTEPEDDIRLRWSRDDVGRPTFSVTDTGTGIAAEHLAHLTERFYRVDAGRSRDSGGTGLGLSIVKHIVSRHSGELLIDSEPGRGSTFSARFPATRAC
ncbi:MAG: phosphate regulon sensor histidine kinase PhoR [Pseudomonadota bacterium]